MRITPRSVLLPAVLVCLLAVNGCSTDGSDTATPAGASEPASASASAAPTTAESSAEPTSEPSSSAPVEPAVALEETFTSPDESLSFRYPTGWTVVVPEDTSEEVRRWVVNDAAGEQVLSLSVRPDQDMYKVSPPLTPLVIPQGEVPGVVDKLGTSTLVGVAATFGQCAGCDAGVLYGMTSATGADPVFGDVQWGDGYLLSFGGSQMLGPNDEVDMAAEAEQFAASTRFRTQILPILQSLTTASAPAPGASTGEADGNGASAAPDPAVEAACAGVQYTYENLQGIPCEEAKAILQVVSDTGEPIGARGQRTAEYHCFWSSAGERDAGHADVICVHRADGTDLFEANYR